MLPGFNHNLRHQGAIFHIQTEDNGLQNPYVVTHVFMGGNVIATRRASYQKFISKPGLREIVLAIMKEQHKEMMKDLVHGRVKAVEQYLGQSQEEMPKEVVPPSQQGEESKQLPTGNPLSTTSSSPKVTSQKPQVRPRQPPPVHVPTLDTSSSADKTLDELILEFLELENQDKKK